MSVDDQLIEGQRWLKADRRAREQSIQIHRDGSIHRNAQFIVAIAPVFNERDIREGLSGGCGHEVMIPPLQRLLSLTE